MSDRAPRRLLPNAGKLREWRGAPLLTLPLIRNRQPHQPLDRPQSPPGKPHRRALLCRPMR